MAGPRDPKELPRYELAGATRRTAIGLILGAPLLGACSGDIARSFGQSLSVLYGSTQPDTYTGGFFPASPGVGGPINVNTDQ